MGRPVDLGLIARSATTPGEPVLLQREGACSRWHARAESGELIGEDKYFNDLTDRLETEGFSVSKAPERAPATWKPPVGTTDIRTIINRNIALDPAEARGERLLAKVLRTTPDGALHLQMVSVCQMAFYKDGMLYRHTNNGREDIGRHVIVWQGRLPGEHPSDVKDGLAKVARRIAAGASGVLSYDEMPVTISRGTLRALADALAKSSEPDAEVGALLENAYRAAE